MALHVTSTEYDNLTADPSTPDDGTIWYRSDLNAFRGRINGTTQNLIDQATFDAHATATTNPHTVTLEQARTAGNTLAGDVAMGGNAITNVSNAATTADVPNLGQVRDEISARLDALDWQESVLDKDLTAPPGSPVLGDRYLIFGVGTGAWAGQDDSIAEWNGASWDFIAPDEGFHVPIEDEGNIVYFWNGSVWATKASATDHGALLGLGDDDHTQYILANGTRAFTGNQSMGGFNLTSVGTVNGVTVEGHAARHERGGADEIDGDHLDIDFTPANYTPSTTPAEAANVDDLAAHLAGIDDALATAGSGLATKAGSVVAGSFTGSPKKATVTFSTAFADANYAIVLTARTTNNKSYTMFIDGTPTASQFVIGVDANNISNLVSVHWTATKDGET